MNINRSIIFEEPLIDLIKFDIEPSIDFIEIDIDNSLDLIKFDKDRLDLMKVDNKIIKNTIINLENEELDLDINKIRNEIKMEKQQDISLLLLLSSLI
jgi:hypothetical protein